MKAYFTILIFLFLLISNSNAQRYLTPVFQNITTTTDIQYGSSTTYQGIPQTLLLDFYEPTGDTEDERPLVIYAHGGGFTDVNQTKSLIHIVAYCDSLASRGYAVASIEYRLDSTICNRAVINAMHDMKAAIRFFKKEKLTYKIDTSLIFLGGESAGAITAFTSNYIDKPSEVTYPPTTPYSSVLSVEGNSGNPGFSSKATATLFYCGGTSTVLNDLLIDTLAMETSFDPPLLQVHGTGDLIIPTDRALHVALRANNIELPFLFHTMPGATHCPWLFPLDNSWEYLDTLIGYTAPFLYAFVLNSTPTQNLNFETAKVNIYPNPSNGILNIDFGKSKLEDVEIEIFNAIGQKVFYQKNENIMDKISLNTNLESGLYWIRIGRTTLRVVIQTANPK